MNQSVKQMSNPNQLYDDIEAYSTFSKPGIEVLSIDVNYDGKDDIVSMGSGF